MTLASRLNTFLLSSAFVFMSTAGFATENGSRRDLFRSAPPAVKGPLVPATSITPGKYVTTSGYLSDVRIRTWASDYTMTGTVSYGGYRYGFEMTLSKDESTGKTNLFRGDGQIKQGWKSGDTCFYTISTEVYAYSGQVYIRDYSPSKIYNEWDIQNKGCPPAAGPYTWTTSPEPYLWKK